MKSSYRQENGDEEGEISFNKEDVIAALNIRAEREGGILLVLDNVESTRVFLREQILEKLSLCQNVRLLATARVSDVVFRPDDHCVEFPLADLSSEAALDLLLRDHPANSETERAAAANIVECLGRRVLYLRAVPALLDDIYSSYAGSYVSLATVLCDNLLTIVDNGMEDIDDVGRTPSAIWKLTYQSLIARSAGKDWIKLVEIASFFSPEGFRPHVLHYLWNSLVTSQTVNKREWYKDIAFVQALKILRRHGLLDIKVQTLSMHRLTREVVRMFTRKESPSLEESIGGLLAKYQRMGPDEWLSLADNLAIIRQIPQWRLSGWQRDDLLRANPEFAHYCPCEKIPEDVFISLFQSSSQFKSSCPWDKLTGRHWVSLLTVAPQFAKRCPWDKLKGDDWVFLLEKQPQYSGCCHWGKLQGADWVYLLEKYPQYAKHCQWEKLCGSDWVCLLEKNPQYANKCRWKRLKGMDWMNLLVLQPQFSCYCSWQKLSGKDWVSLLAKQPQFAEHCRWDRLDKYDWADLLAAQPQFADQCPWEEFDEWFSWDGLLSEQPQFADRCPWNRASIFSWNCLLTKQPQFADRCPWKELDGLAWAWLLAEQPQYADRCLWEKLKGYDWASLLSKQPQFADHCSWEKLKGNDWALLLSHQPQFASHCLWDKLCDADWESLLYDQPQFAYARPNGLLNVLGEI